MRFDATVRIEDGRLRSLIDKLRPDLTAVVAIAAHNVEGRAKEIVRVDTGATSSSIYVSIAGGQSNYMGAASDARSRRPGVKLIPEAVPGGETGLVARIGPSTSYAPDLEFGGHNRRAYPFMIPALEQNRQPFIDAVQEVVRRG